MPRRVDGPASAMTPRYPMPQPYGWFHVCYSDELPNGAVLAFRFFGREVVLFRTAQGRAHLVDAFCPHLGAHLGHGGRVVGESLVCPFHGWHFDGEGVCVDIPYARSGSKLVGRRCLQTWEVCEANRSIFAWYHPGSARPHFEVVRLPELTHSDEQWTPLLRRRWVVRCHIQEAHENIADRAHFACVHGLEPSLQYSFEGHRSRIVMDSAPPGVSLPTRIVTERNGPGQSWAHYEGFPRFLVLDTVTPIDDERVAFNVAVTFHGLGAERMRAVHEKVLGDICAQVERDIPIFEHKIYRSKPLYCEQDGPIAEFRKWYGQFYA